MAGKVEVFLGLGGNMGDRLSNLRRAVALLAARKDCRVLAVSGVFESEYVGPGQQAPYLNGCLKLETSLSGPELLVLLKDIEGSLGRRPDGHMKPRPVDLDILLYGRQVLAGPGLQVPHPRLRDRAFVLEPLAQIAGLEKFPDSGETVASVCAKIRRKSGPWIQARPQWSLQPDPVDPRRKEPR